jgi:predicted enzyme related to lactoylglutathione lyase
MTTSIVLMAVLFGGTVLAELPPPELKASMVVLGVADVQRSVKFYRDVLALAPAPAPGDLPMFRSGELTIVLNGGMPSSGTGFELVFPVASVSAVRKQLVERGCKFEGEAREIAPNMWASTFNDPDGHHLTLFGGR